MNEPPEIFTARTVKLWSATKIIGFRRSEKKFPALTFFRILVSVAISFFLPSFLPSRGRKVTAHESSLVYNLGTRRRFELLGKNVAEGHPLMECFESEDIDLNLETLARTQG